MPSNSLSFFINTSRLPDGCLVFRSLARWFGSNGLTLKEGYQKKQALNINTNVNINQYQC